MPTTNSAYGSGDDNNLCDEKSPLNPISTYAKDKVHIEEVLMQKENVISLRLATVFGMFALNGLPRYHHPLFNSALFKDVNCHKFVLAIEAKDPKFDLDGVREFLESLSPVAVDLVEDCDE